MDGFFIDGFFIYGFFIDGFFIYGFFIYGFSNSFIDEVFSNHAFPICSTLSLSTMEI
jgi:hypothetical protein